MIKPTINKRIHKNNDEYIKKYLNSIEGYSMKRKELLNGMDKKGKRKNKETESCQKKKNDKGGHAKHGKEKLEVNEFVEKEENSFWNEDCLS